MSSPARSVVRVELVYDRDCPNVNRARAMIAAALDVVDVGGNWTEWDRDDPATPAELRRYGSPTVLVNGRDVGCDENEDSRGEANSCRIYVDESERFCGAPSSDLIVHAIRGAKTT